MCISLQNLDICNFVDFTIPFICDQPLENPLKSLDTRSAF